jgi:hypothetical protein
MMVSRTFDYPFPSGAFTMSDLIQNVFSLPTPFNMVVIIAAIGAVSGLIVTVATQIQKYASLRHELDFKREMIDRGMSVEEIERLVRAKSADQRDENK